MKIEGLNPGDHRFIPTVENIENIRCFKVHPPTLSTEKYSEEIEKRWDDFVEERKSRGLDSKDGDIVCTFYDKSFIDISNNLILPLFEYKFKPWVTTRPAFKWASDEESESITFPEIYTLGAGGLAFVEDNSEKYMVFGSRHRREVGGEIDTPPAGFMKISDLCLDFFVNNIIRESKEELVAPEKAILNGAMISDYWRNLTACYDLELKMDELLEKFDISEDGEMLVARRKDGKATKYGEDGIFFYPLGKLDSYVTDNAKRFGERAALLLTRYFEQF